MALCLFEKCSHKGLISSIVGSRISFRCFDLSDHFFGLGSSSGDVFIFSRNSQRLLRRLPAASAKIDRVAFNPANDNVLCVASSRGELVIIEHNILVAHSQPARELYRSDVHTNSTVLQLLWSRTGSLFIGGDNRGLVSITDLYAVSGGVLFDVSPTNILTLDSQIVQIDTYRDRLAISTLTASYLCDLDDKRFTKIGRKPRNGVFGVCFSEILPRKRTYPDVYCARPGGRLWRVNNFGEVDCTLSFRHEGSTDMDHVPIPLCGTTRGELLFDRKTQFGLLIPVGELLMTFTDEVLYVLQVQEYDIPRIIWQSTSFKSQGLLEAKVQSKSIFLLHNDGALTEWGFSTKALQNVYHIFPSPEQRLTVVMQNLDCTRVAQYLDLIRQQKYRGKELVRRRTDSAIIPIKPNDLRFQSPSVETFLAMFHCFLSILHSLDKRWLRKSATLLFSPQQDSLAEFSHHCQLGDDSIVNVSTHTNLPSVSQSNFLGRPTSMTPPKQKSTARRTHRKLLDRISRQLQKKIADSLLIELNGSLWAKPQVLQEKHFIDQPLTDWGFKFYQERIF
ncbi:Hermansky-Pudlak syndrome 5 protein-like [Tropilaelaps mercedesae]|uniref:Hermansky-Pudlak syndrome 5 protein-like n=1 Tax=Tropilaelaps mercedesae TaxID=418985 RepID=A0A1V9XUN9_9ACAR|nr:Hermansky-Pudlak syndrome 5 protein-like [Tropilaelaps mercedesae]